MRSVFLNIDVGLIGWGLSLFMFSVAFFSCDRGKEDVLWIRVNASKNRLTINCVSEFELTFKPVGQTRFLRGSEGSWAGGEVNYGMKQEEGGVDIFYIIASGDWIYDEIMKNREKKYPHEFIFEIPLKNIDAEGSFELRGYWRYKGVTTARIENGSVVLSLPDPDNIFPIILERVTDDLCLMHPADGEEEDGVEVVELEEERDYVEILPEQEEVEEVVDVEEVEYDMEDQQMEGGQQEVVEDFLEFNSEDGDEGL